MFIISLLWLLFYPIIEVRFSIIPDKEEKDNNKEKDSDKDKYKDKKNEKDKNDSNSNAEAFVSFQASIQECKHYFCPVNKKEMISIVENGFNDDVNNT